jgi:Ca2+-binding RTX toxin-like protein
MNGKTGLATGLALLLAAGMAWGGGESGGEGKRVFSILLDLQRMAGANLNGGNDLILGGAGDDTLNGGTGNDVLYGGAGNDTYVFNLGNGQDTIVESQGNSELAGQDAIVFGAGIRAGELDIYIDGDKLVFAHINGRDKLTVANWFDSLADSAHRLDSVSFADGASLDLSALQLGSAGNDTIIGTSQSDILMGGAGDDILISDGNDWLDGGTGADTMSGSIGDDIYVVDNAGDQVIELEGEGTDTVHARASATLAANVENLLMVGTAAINGTGNELDNVMTGNDAGNALYGMAGNDTLIGNGGNDLLDGGEGADLMMGGTGDDGYVVDTLDDQVIEQAGQGKDTVYTALSYTLGQNIENLTLTGNAAVSGTGNELDNILTGNAADNTLMGLAGNDTIDGGAGADTLMGGTGDDTYIVDNAGDQIIEVAGEGIDLVKASIDYTLTNNTENLTLTGTQNLTGTGNALDNILTGNAGNNTLIGLDGNDTYVIDSNADIIIENADEGIDTVRSSITTTLGQNLENLILTSGSINGTGNELNNVLIGSGGNNILDGGLGADQMAGGTGNDTYIVDNTADAIVELADEGTDNVQASASYTLSANVENLTLTGTGSINGTGNAQDNVILGNAGNNRLDGGAGADQMAGGAGNDTYVVDNIGDQVTESANAGTDTVEASIDTTLGANLENLTLTGAAIVGAGNTANNLIYGNAGDNLLSGMDGADTLFGNAGNDTLDGGSGADRMAGGTGDDTYIVESAGDLVHEATGEGNDTVRASVAYTLTTNVENLILTEGDATEAKVGAGTTAGNGLLISWGGGCANGEWKVAA